MKYDIPTIPDPIPATLDELKVLGDTVKALRTQASTDVQEGREAMDECDRLLGKLQNAVDGIMGIKKVPTKEEREQVLPAEVHQKKPAKAPAPGEKVPPHSPTG